MPKYFFHFERAGKVITDPEGTELGDVAEARHEAFLNARDLIIRILKTEEPVPLDDNVHVTDGHGTIICTVMLREALGSVRELR